MPFGPKRIVLAIVTALLLSACATTAASDSDDEAGVAHTIDWDVLQGHELDRIDWDAVAGERDIVILTGGVDLRLVLPGGEIVDDTFERIMLERDETHLLTVDAVFDRDLTVDETMELAEQLAPRFDLALHNFEQWQQRAGRAERDGGWVDVRANANGQPMSDRGPEPSIRPIRSGRDDRPVRLRLQFYWVADGDEY